MEREDRVTVMQRREVMDQQFVAIQEKYKIIVEMLSVFSHNPSGMLNHVVVTELSPAQTDYRQDKTYLNIHQLKNVFNLESIDDYIMPLQHRAIKYKY